MDFQNAVQYCQNATYLRELKSFGRRNDIYILWLALYAKQKRY